MRGAPDPPRVSCLQLEKYRPTLIKDVVGNVEALSRLQVIAEEGNMPNLILAVRSAQTMTQWRPSKARSPRLSAEPRALSLPLRSLAGTSWHRQDHIDSLSRSAAAGSKLQGRCPRTQRFK